MKIIYLLIVSLKIEIMCFGIFLIIINNSLYQLKVTPTLFNHYCLVIFKIRDDLNDYIVDTNNLAMDVRIIWQ
jgi:hypothetical protein